MTWRPTLLFGLICFSITLSYGQQEQHNPIPTNLIEFPNPENGPKQAPIMTKTADAVAEAKANLATCGFTGVFFSKEDLNNLLGVNKSVGIRFYIGMEDSKQRFVDIIAVAINKDGKEIAKFLTRKYRMCKALDVNYPDDTKWINKKYARGCVNNLANGQNKYIRYTAYLSRTMIETQWKVSECQGLRISPATFKHADGKMYRTMSFGPAMIINNDAVDISGTDYLKVQLPCPVECGDIDNYLVR